MYLQVQFGHKGEKCEGGREDSVEKAYESKKLRYADWGAEGEQRGWKVWICALELGYRRCVA